MYSLDGKILELDAPFEHAGNLYPPSWLRLSTPSDRAAIGITEMQDVAVPNSKFYYVHQLPTGVYHKIPRDLEQLKQVLTDEIDREVSRLLAPSDYRVIKALETGEDMPQSWKTWRQTVRTQAKTAKTEIASAVTVEELEQLHREPWAADPNTVSL